MKFKYRFADKYRQRQRDKSVTGGVEVGGPIMNFSYPVSSNYCVDVVLSRYATGIDKWSVCINDNILIHFTLERLPDCIKNAVTLIAPYADEKGLRQEIGVRSSVAFPEGEWPDEFVDIGWYVGKAIWYPYMDFDSPVEEHLFMVVVTPDQLSELRDRIKDKNIVGGVNDLSLV